MYVRWVFCGWLWMNCLMIVEKHPKWSTALLTPIMRYIPFLCVHHHTLARICRRSTHLWVTYNTHSSCCDELNDRMKEKKNTHTARINPSTRFNLHQLIHPLRQIRCIYIHFLSLLFMKSNAMQHDTQVQIHRRIYISSSSVGRSRCSSVFAEE